MATSITQESQIGLTKKRSSQTLGTPCSCTNPIIIIDDEDEETLDSKNQKTNNPRAMNSSVSLLSNDVITNIRKEEALEPMKKKPGLESFDELSKVVNGLPKSNDPVDSCLSSTYLHEKKKKDDLSEDKSVDSGYRHVTLEELGVTVKDLKSMAWELFDPIWEIRSETMDPWLGGYIKDIISADHYNSLA